MPSVAEYPGCRGKLGDKRPKWRKRAVETLDNWPYGAILIAEEEGRAKAHGNASEMPLLRS